MNNPTLSVLMAVYNGMPYLPEAMESVLQQTFQDLEFVIVNDCSKDQTAQVLESYALKDSRVRVFHNKKNLRQTASLNKGLQECRGKYLGRIDSDDRIHLGRFENQIQFLESHPDVGMVGSDWEVINEKGEVTGQGTRPCSDAALRWTQFFTCPVGASGTCRTEILKKLKGYNEIITLPQDWELCSRMLKVTKFHSLAKPYYILRRHEDQSSTQNQEEARRQSNWVVRQSAVNLFPGIPEEKVERIERRSYLALEDRWKRSREIAKQFKKHDPETWNHPEFQKLMLDEWSVCLQEAKRDLGFIRQLKFKLKW